MKKSKMGDFINDNLYPSSSDKSDNGSDNDKSSD